MSNNPIDRFTAAELVSDTAVRAWNALPTPQARGASTIDLDLPREVLDRAAVALLREAAGRHHIEERAIVWLRLSEHGWVIDHPTFDGCPLEGNDTGPDNQHCLCTNDDECRAVTRATALLAQPDAPTLRDLLQRAARHRPADLIPAFSTTNSVARRRIEAAWTLISRAANRHRIEERSVVPLVLDSLAWAVDPAVFTAGPLPGYDRGPLNEVCECRAPQQCERLLRAAGLLSLPDAGELLALLDGATCVLAQGGTLPKGDRS